MSTKRMSPVYIIGFILTFGCGDLLADDVLAPSHLLVMSTADVLGKNGGTVLEVSAGNRSFDSRLGFAGWAELKMEIPVLTRSSIFPSFDEADDVSSPAVVGKLRLVPERKYLPALVIQYHHPYPFVLFELDSTQIHRGFLDEHFSGNIYYEKRNTRFTLVSSKTFNPVRIHLGGQWNHIQVKKIQYYISERVTESVYRGLGSKQSSDFIREAFSPLFGLEVQLHRRATLLAELRTELALTLAQQTNFATFSSDDLVGALDWSVLVGTRLRLTDRLTTAVGVEYDFTGMRRTKIHGMLNMMQPIGTSQRVRSSPKPVGSPAWPITGTVLTAGAGGILGLILTADTASTGRGFFMGAPIGGFIGYQLGQRARQRDLAGWLCRGGIITAGAGCVTFGAVMYYLVKLGAFEN